MRSRYLVDYAESLAINTLRQRLAALAQWHIDQGFPDLTKAPVVRKVLRGIKVLHPVREKQARPLQLEQLEQLEQWLNWAVAGALAAGDRPAQLRHTPTSPGCCSAFGVGFVATKATGATKA